MRKAFPVRVRIKPTSKYQDPHGESVSTGVHLWLNRWATLEKCVDVKPFGIIIVLISLAYDNPFPRLYLAPALVGAGIRL
jgi:hypothetical protein